MKKTPASSSKIASSANFHVRTSRISSLQTQGRTEAQLPQVFSLRSLLEQDPVEQDWVVAGLLPTGVSLLASSPQVDKALLANQLGLSVATGQPFLADFAVSQGHVLYLALADGAQQVRGRTVRLLGPQEQPTTFTVALRWSSFHEGGLADLEDTIARLDNLRLIIIDPLEVVSPLYPSQGAGNRTPQAFLPTREPGFFIPLRQLAAHYKLAILLLHHLPEDWPLNRRDPLAGLSSTGLTPATACNLLLAPESGPHAYNSGVCTLHIAGPQVEERRLTLLGDTQRGRWNWQQA